MQRVTVLDQDGASTNRVDRDFCDGITAPVLDPHPEVAFPPGGAPEGAAYAGGMVAVARSGTFPVEMD